jgi:hypothetical protein
MKVVIEDAATFQSLKPLEIAAYLRSKHWHREADLSGKADLWVFKKHDTEEFDLTLPNRRSFADYALRIAEVLQTLAKVEDRSELEILRDLQSATADLIRIRTPSDSSDNGTLPLDKGVNFVERSRDMMLAAACAALEKRSVYAKRKAQQAMDYLHRIRMGQTERGSYVLTILSPVTPELQPAQGALFPADSEDPYERRVTRTLMGALSALNVASRRAAINGNIAPYLEAIEQGVSANLCDAVAGLLAISPGQGVEIQTAWSQTRPLIHNVESRITFDSDSAPFLQEASRRFRESAPQEDFEIEGFVVRLDRNPTSTQGEVTILANVDGQLRRIGMSLGTDQYSRAVEAHEERRAVTCVGDLIKMGKGYSLQNPRHFAIMIGDEGGDLD